MVDQNSFRTVFKDLTGLRADCTSLEGNEAVQRALMTLIEVKRYQSKDKELIDALPQVIAQTIIAGRRSKPRGQTPRTIPFVLANGFEWFFGVIKLSPSSNGEGDWICFRSECHTIPTEGLETDAPPESKEATRDGIRVFFDMLLHWVGFLGSGTITDDSDATDGLPKDMFGARCPHGSTR